MDFLVILGYSLFMWWIIIGMNVQKRTQVCAFGPQWINEWWKLLNNTQCHSNTGWPECVIQRLDWFICKTMHKWKMNSILSHTMGKIIYVFFSCAKSLWSFLLILQDQKGCSFYLENQEAYLASFLSTTRRLSMDWSGHLQVCVCLSYLICIILHGFFHIFTCIFMRKFHNFISNHFEKNVILRHNAKLTCNQMTSQKNLFPIAIPSSRVEISN